MKSISHPGPGRGPKIILGTPHIGVTLALCLLAYLPVPGHSSQSVPSLLDHAKQIIPGQPVPPQDRVQNGVVQQVIQLWL